MWFFLSKHQRKEARSRSPDFASYYARMHGDLAEAKLIAKMRRQRRGSYHRLLYRLALVELRRRRRMQQPMIVGPDARSPVVLKSRRSGVGGLSDGDVGEAGAGGVGV